MRALIKYRHSKFLTESVNHFLRTHTRDTGGIENKLHFVKTWQFALIFINYFYLLCGLERLIVISKRLVDRRLLKI